MKRTAHGLNSSNAPARSALPRSLALVTLACAAGAGCNIVQGYQDAGDSLFPEQSTHLASPGVRLVSGQYRGLGLVAGSELYLLARAADDDTGKLFSMRYADPQPCELSGVVRLSVTREESRAAPLFSYFQEDVRRGTLRFADAACKTYALSFEDARLPVAETERSVVVWAGSDLWLATPETGEKERLAEGVAEVVRGVFGQRFAVRADGRLSLFDSAWKAQGTFGEGVSTVLRAGDGLFYLDSVGAHQIVESDADPLVLEDRLLAADACSLASQDDKWITLRSPCTDGAVVAIHARTGKSFTLPFDADPRHLQLVPALNSRGRDPLNDRFWFFYLRSGDSDESRDTLFVRTPAGEEHRLGANATLRQLRLLESEDETHGYALVDVEGETGRYLWWNTAGETRVLAENVMWRPKRLIVDFDGTVGSVAVTSGQRLRVLAERVPWQAFEYRDSSKKWTVLFHDMQEGMGRLSVFPAGLDELQAVPPRQPFQLPELSTITSKAVVLGTSSMDRLLSGVTYLENFDWTKRTGRLEYRNLELRFTAKVSEGVSDYFVLNNELLYAVPYGEAAGIWIVSGK